MTDSKPTPRPIVSVIILNYNGQVWLSRCFESLEKQTVFDRIEVIVTDNKSSDGSDTFAADWLERTGKGRVVQNGANLYYTGANNNGAAVASGDFFLFLNNDTWLEPECLEKLYREVTRTGADAGAPMVMDYEDDTYQDGGDSGIDLFGLVTHGTPATTVRDTFFSPGCGMFIRAEMFWKIGGFAPELLIYCDETDLSWRVWIAGGRIVSVPSARLHHRGAAVVNPQGATKIVEIRTSETKRFLSNRNAIFFLLKNSQHLLLLLLIPHLLLLAMEALVSLALVRRWSFVQKSYWAAVADVFRMRSHVLEWRRRIRGFRQRGDFYMLRFLRLVPNRWDEIKRMFKYGPPKVESK